MMKLNLVFVLAALHRCICVSPKTLSRPMYPFNKIKGEIFRPVDIDCASYHAGCIKVFNKAVELLPTAEGKCSSLGEYNECMQLAQCMPLTSGEEDTTQYLKFYQTKNEALACNFPVDAAYCNGAEVQSMFEEFPKAKVPCEKVMGAGEVTQEEKCACYSEILMKSVVEEGLVCKFKGADAIRPVAMAEWEACVAANPVSLFAPNEETSAGHPQGPLSILSIAGAVALGYAFTQ